MYTPDVGIALVGIKFAKYTEKLTRISGEPQQYNSEEPTYVATYQYDGWERHGCVVSRLNASAGAISESATACVTVSDPSGEREPQPTSVPISAAAHDLHGRRREGELHSGTRS